MEAFKWLKRKSYGKADQQVPLVMCILAELEFSMHCDNCANDVRTCCKRTKGVETVELDKQNKLVIVKGRFGHNKLLSRLRNANKIVKVRRLVMEGTQGEDESSLKNEIGTQGGQEDDHDSKPEDQEKLQLATSY